MVPVAPQVSGYVTEVPVVLNQIVEEGDLLLRIHSRAQLDRAQRNFNRVEAIAVQNPGALSQADRDRATTQLAQAEAGVFSAEAELERARETLGVEGEDNPAIRAAAAALEQAEFNLEQTEIRAPGRGIVGDLQLAEGHYAVAGQPLATLISGEDVWVRADMRENNLGRIEIGDPAEVAHGSRLVTRPR